MKKFIYSATYVVGWSMAYVGLFLFSMPLALIVGGIALVVISEVSQAPTEEEMLSEK